MKKVSVFVIFLLVAATLAGCSHPDCMGPNIVMEIQSFGRFIQGQLGGFRVCNCRRCFGTIKVKFSCQA